VGQLSVINSPSSSKMRLYAFPAFVFIESFAFSDATPVSTFLQPGVRSLQLPRLPHQESGHRGDPSTRSNQCHAGRSGTSQPSKRAGFGL
jgi:hypothetical protein